MKTTRFLALVAVLLVSGVASATAGEWGSCGREGWGGKDKHWEGGWNYHDHVGDFCKKHGVKFSHGYFYAGKEQKHFVRKWYDRHFETDMCFDPHAHCPYYWCEGHGVWYPIQYIEKVGPGAKGPGPVVGKPEGGPGVAKPEGGPGGPVAPGVGSGGGAVGPKPPSDGAGTGAPPATGEKAVAPGGTPNKPAGDGPPPEPTSSSPERVARAQSAPRDEPKGTFDDAIPETK